MTSKTPIVSSLLLLVCAVAQASAASIVVTANPALGGDNPSFEQEIDDSIGDFETHDDGTSTWVGDLSNDIFGITWNLTFDPDPSVSGSLSITNNTNVTQFFSTETGIPSAVALPAGSPMSGASAISVSRIVGSTATMAATAGDSIYTGQITGIPQRRLFLDPYSLTASSGTVNIDLQAFSGETTTTALPLNGILSVRHAFTLTAGDTATTNSTFEVVPEPTGFALLVISMIGLGVVRRRS